MLMKEPLGFGKRNGKWAVHLITVHFIHDILVNDIEVP